MRLSHRIFVLVTVAGILGLGAIFLSVRRLDLLYTERDITMSEFTAERVLVTQLDREFDAAVTTVIAAEHRIRDPGEARDNSATFLQRWSHLRSKADEISRRASSPELRLQLQAFLQEFETPGEAFALGKKSAGDGSDFGAGIDLSLEKAVLLGNRLHSILDSLETARYRYQDNQRSIWRDMEHRIHALLAILLVFLLGIAWVFSRQIVRPLHRLSQSMKIAATSADSGIRLVPEAPADMGSIVRNYNDILDRVQDRNAAIRHEKDKVVEKEKRINALVASVSDGVFTADVSGRVIFWNPGAESIFGHTGAEMQGRLLADVLPALTGGAIALMLLKEFRPDRPDDLRTILKTEGTRKDGSCVVVEFSPAAWKSDGQTHFGGILRDVTERERVGRLKDEFVTLVNHELRTPLTAAQGSLGLLTAGVAGALPPTAKSMAEIAQSSVVRLGKLLTDILAIQSIEFDNAASRLESLEIALELEKAVKLQRSVKPSAAERFVVRGVIPGARIRADQELLQSMLSRLLDNAAKFSPVDKPVEASIRRERGRIRLEVADRGAGIPLAFRGRIFEKFAQAESSNSRTIQGQGSGLGLSICRAIINKFGGAIGFEDREGGGTIFFAEFPEDNPDAGTCANAPFAALSPPHCSDRPSMMNLPASPSPIPSSF